MEYQKTTHRTGGSWPEGRYVVDINANSNLRMAVYGDSFGDGPLVSKKNFVANINDWWPTRLAIRLQLKSIENFCAGATPFLFAYNTFLNNYQNYDINIVLVTDPNRYTAKVLLPTVSHLSVYHATSITQLEAIKQSYELTTSEIRTVDDLITWHMIKDDKFLLMTQQLMIDNILKKAPKTIIIPCFKQSAPLLNIGLNDLVEYQWSTFGLKYTESENYIEKPEIIGCHFTPEMNAVVSEIVFNRLMTGEWNWNYPKITHEHPIEYYYNKK